MWHPTTVSNPTSQLEINLADTLHFLEAIHTQPGPSRRIEIRYQNRSRPWQMNPRFYASHHKAVADIAILAHGHNVFMGIAARKATGGGTDNDLVDRSALLVDLDVGKPGSSYASIEDALAALDAFSKSATMIIASGTGLHAYWLLTEHYSMRTRTERDNFGRFSRGLTAHLRGDPAPVSASQTMRVPGTFNYKRDTTALASILQSDNGQRYDLGDFLPWAADIMPEPESKVESGKSRVTQPTGRLALSRRKTDKAGEVAAEQALEFAIERGLSREMERDVRWGAQKGRRSDLDFSVICRLVAIGAEATIPPIYAFFRIGAKYWENGGSYLERTISSAKERLEAEHTVVRNSDLDSDVGEETPIGHQPNLELISLASDSARVDKEGARWVEIFVAHPQRSKGTFLMVNGYATAMAGIQKSNIKSGRRLLIASEHDLGDGERLQRRSADNCECHELVSRLRTHGFPYYPWDDPKCPTFTEGGCLYSLQYQQRPEILSVSRATLYSSFVRDLTIVVLASPPPSPYFWSIGFDEMAVDEMAVEDEAWAALFMNIREVCSSVDGFLEGHDFYKALGDDTTDRLAKSLPFTRSHYLPAIDRILKGERPVKNLGGLADSLTKDAREYRAGRAPWRVRLSQGQLLCRHNKGTEELEWLARKCLIVTSNVAPTWRSLLEDMGVVDFRVRPDKLTDTIIAAFSSLEQSGQPTSMRAIARTAGCHKDAIRARKDELATRLGAEWRGGRGRSGCTLVRVELVTSEGAFGQPEAA